MAAELDLAGETRELGLVPLLKRLEEAAGVVRRGGGKARLRVLEEEVLGLDDGAEGKK